MSLKAEWNKRIELWLEELKRHFYIEIGTIEFEGCFTKEHLSYEEAMQRTFQPMPVGTAWGEKWEYGWFRGEICLPPSAEGKRIFLKTEMGGEMLVWINGRIAGSRDLEHDGVTLTRNAKSGERYLIVTESYAGHGPRLESAGPNPPERIAVPEPPKCQVVVQKSSFGIWNEEAFLLYIDAMTLEKLRWSLSEKSLRAMKIYEGLSDFTRIADFELLPEEREKSFRKARERLQPLLSCVNGSTAPLYTIFGQSHLDLAWKWPWEETKRKCARTISTQLALAEEYPDYKFLLCEPPIMENLKENYPEVYGRLRKGVENGQFLPEGGVYVEMDTNLPSGESLIRQCIWGKRWYKEELSYDTKMVWLPDCFGFSGQLPQIFTKSGLKYFATQKIARALKGCEEFPYNIFLWEGIDGSKILTHFYKKNNSRFDPALLNERWNNDRVQQENIDTFLFPFGFGDGGGGATREMLEFTLRCKDLEGAPRTKYQSPVAFFEAIEEHGLPSETYVGEIYLSWHRGTYTAQAKTKRESRKAEIALHEAEFWGSVSRLPGGKEKLHNPWKVLLFEQFHDILPGTSITRVQKEAEEHLIEVRSQANRVMQEAFLQIIHNNKENSEKEAITVFNSLSWTRVALVPLPKHRNGAYNSAMEVLPSQLVGDTCYVEVLIPSCGYVTIYPFDKAVEKKADAHMSSKVSVRKVGNDIIMENEFVRIQINKIGQISSILEKEKNIEFADGLCNDFRMYQDINIDYDAWEMTSFYEELPVELSSEAVVEIVESGPLLGKVRVSRALNSSSMQQEIILMASDHRVDFHTTVEWKETHKLLKVAFPVNVFTEEAIEEIQFGYVKRPTHRSRRYDADRFEVCNQKYTALAETDRGFAVLNDCKYGVSTNGGSIELTLLRAPVKPDMYADKGLQEFTYSFYAYTGSFSNSDVVRKGYELNYPVQTCSGDAGIGTLFGVNHKNVIIETVKPAEDGSEDLIVRLYEAQKSHTSCELRVDLPVKKAYETNMLEEEERELQILRNSMRMNQAEYNTDVFNSVRIPLSFHPFEIKTIRLKNIY